MSFLSSLLGGGNSKKNNNDEPPPPPYSNGPVQPRELFYQSSRLTIHGEDNFMWSHVSEKHMFSMSHWISSVDPATLALSSVPAPVPNPSPFATGPSSSSTPSSSAQLNQAAPDRCQFALCSVSSDDPIIRYGDVVTLWIKENGGMCLFVEPAAQGSSYQFGDLTRSLVGKPRSQAPVDEVHSIGLEAAQKSSGDTCHFVIVPAGLPNFSEYVALCTSGWQCGRCAVTNKYVSKKCESCSLARRMDPDNSFPVRENDFVTLVPVNFPHLQVTLSEGKLVAKSLSYPVSFQLRPLTEQNLGYLMPPKTSRPPTLADSLLTSTVLAGLNVTSKVAQYITAQNPRLQPGDQALLTAAPVVHQVAESRYRNNHSQMAEDLDNTLRVADRVASHPATQQIATNLFAVAASVLLTAANGTTPPPQYQSQPTQQQQQNASRPK